MRAGGRQEDGSVLVGQSYASEEFTMSIRHSHPTSEEHEHFSRTFPEKSKSGNYRTDLSFVHGVGSSPVRGGEAEG